MLCLNSLCRKSILTDSFLRVRGAEGVFALGDCSTIEQDLMIKRAEELFKMADVNGDGTLCSDEFLSIMETAKRKYPQVQVQLTYVENDCKRYRVIACVQPILLPPPCLHPSPSLSLPPSLHLSPSNPASNLACTPPPPSFSLSQSFSSNPASTLLPPSLRLSPSNPACTPLPPSLSLSPSTPASTPASAPLPPSYSIFFLLQII